MDVNDSVIDPDGDLICVLPQAEFRVSSKVLCIVSRVFRAMLSRQYAEGNFDLVDGMRKIRLPGK